MKIFLFAKRNALEILREPTSLFFGAAFPLILLALLSVINRNIPVEAGNAMFSIDHLAPGIAMFGPVFMALFSATLLSKDRTSSFLTRLFTSPMTPLDFILGYTLPLIGMAAVQALITFLASVLFGLKFSANILLAVVAVIPVAFLFVGIGLLCGSLLSDKAVGGICGALLTNVSGWLAGIWFPLEVVGGGFKALAMVLPFYHGAEMGKAVIGGNYGEIPSHLLVVMAYAVAIYALACVVFRKKMSGDAARG
jgi:ABC-2 type transport system permease protein